MKILYFIDSLVPSGAEISLLGLAPEYHRAGICLEIAYLHDRPGLQSQFRRLGVPLFCLEADGRRVEWALQARRLVQRRRPDLIHTTLFESDLIGRIAGATTSRPVVSSLVNVMYGREQFDDPKWSPLKVRLAQASDVATARVVRRFHAVSEHVAEIMSRRLLVDRTCIDVVLRGRDPLALGERTPARRARIRNKLGIGLETPLLLTVARHEFQKGLDVAIAAVHEIVRRFPGTKFIIAGREGNATHDLRAAVTAHGLEGSVTFLGVRDDVPDLIVAADVFVMPSLWEGLGGTAIEAMALKVPIVASDIPPIREVVGSDGAARTFTPGDAAGLTRAVIEVLKDPEGAALRTESGYRRFCERFTIESVAQQMLAFYDRALGANDSANTAA